MNQPLISVIVPCYNQSQYLDECLQSVLEQTYQNWECIIVNDGSPDNTEEVALKWIAKDTRFNYLNKDNGGLSSARNAGIKIAKGEWVLPLDSDDKIGNKYLELAAKQFDKGYTVIYCKARKFGTDNSEWLLKEFSLKNLAEYNVIFCSAFFKKQDWMKTSGYDVTLIYGLEDWDFWISLLKDKNETTTHKLDYFGFYYRVKDSSMTIELKNEKRMRMEQIIVAKHILFFYEKLGSFHHMYHQNRILKQDSSNYRKLFSNKLFRILLKLKLIK
ncbi:glycosyltransferase family 2 protein [Empedobacter brevis]|uniref:Glycosyltransferase family 2 protein n=1 Tax=Empedobacter brevis TaxID=247 RepID=A0AAJ1V9K4_9FLAO|nr:glycosyltransferase family A protein [Empedobacter brevis]MDM1073040.1 glycosyltransferase family 2 protein [Empedobacter brevis]